MEISKTADQALLVLLDLAGSTGRTPSDIARSLDLNRTVVHRLLATLEGRGFVRRSSEPAAFVLGPALLELAEHTETNLRRIADQAMRELARTVGETVLLFAPNRRYSPPHADLVAQVLGDHHVVRVKYDSGHAVPLSLSAGGRAILAFTAPEGTRAAAAATPDATELERELARIRTTRIAFSEAELLPGVCAIATPVLDEHDLAVASLVIAAPNTRRETIRGMSEDLLHGAAEIAATLREASTFDSRAPMDNHPALAD